MGGEKIHMLLCVPSAYGSPPRGRGKVLLLLDNLLLLGITPAWAGKSCPEWRGMLRSGDHPRVGGEKWVLPSVLMVGLGSPPRGRGKD